MNQKRYDFIDIAKGLGMILVIWGHIILHGPLNNFIYSFHMPLFFFISGMLFAPQKYANVKEFVKRKIKTLLIPYFLLSILTYIWWVLVENRISNSSNNIIFSFIQIFIAQGSSSYMLHNIPMWFVSCLFFVEILYIYIYIYIYTGHIKSNNGLLLSY